MIRIINNSALALLLAVALGYLLQKSVLDTSDTVDFKYIWLAGDLWARGENPYSDKFAAAGESVFVGLNRPKFWFYPPNWWPVARISAMAPYEVARLWWRAVGAIFILGGCGLLSLAAHRALGGIPLWRHVVFLSFTCLMSATAIALSLGQTSPMVFFGVCVFAAAWLRANRALMALGLVILALKPNIGIVFAALLIPSAFWWPSLGVAAAVTVLAALPAIWMHGVRGVFAEFLSNVSDYGGIAENTAASMTGLRRLMDYFFATDVKPMALVVLSFIFCFIIGVYGSKNYETDNRPMILLSVILITTFMVPMHSYDVIFISTILILSAIYYKGGAYGYC